jgi:hypothetical protein
MLLFTNFVMATNVAILHSIFQYRLLHKAFDDKAHLESTQLYVDKRRSRFFYCRLAVFSICFFSKLDLPHAVLFGTFFSGPTTEIKNWGIRYGSEEER